MKKIIIVLLVLVIVIGYGWWSLSPQKGEIKKTKIAKVEEKEETKFEITKDGSVFYGPNSSYKIAVKESAWKGNWDEVVGVKMRQISPDYVEEKIENGLKFSKKDQSEITWYKKIDNRVVLVSLTLNTNDLEAPLKKVDEIWDEIL